MLPPSPDHLLLPTRTHYRIEIPFVSERMVVTCFCAYAGLVPAQRCTKSGKTPVPKYKTPFRSLGHAHSEFPVCEVQSPEFTRKVWNERKKFGFYLQLRLFLSTSALIVFPHKLQVPQGFDLFHVVLTTHTNELRLHH